jgi:hypothetical protein
MLGKAAKEYIEFDDPYILIVFNPAISAIYAVADI